MPSKTLHVVTTPRGKNPGVVELVASCNISHLQTLIGRMGCVPTPFSEMNPEISKGVNNMVVSIHPYSVEPHPKNNRSSYPGYSSDGNKINVIALENLPMAIRIAVTLKEPVPVAATSDDEETAA